eukprot:3097257-Pleurochrysis_carterae.AAC.7
MKNQFGIAALATSRQELRFRQRPSQELATAVINCRRLPWRAATLNGLHLIYHYISIPRIRNPQDHNLSFKFYFIIRASAWGLAWLLGRSFSPDMHLMIEPLRHLQNTLISDAPALQSKVQAAQLKHDVIWSNIQQLFLSSKAETQVPL